MNATQSLTQSDRMALDMERRLAPLMAAVRAAGFDPDAPGSCVSMQDDDLRGYYAEPNVSQRVVDGQTITVHAEGTRHYFERPRVECSFVRVG